MSLWNPNDIEYPVTVTITRPQGTYDANGDYTESFATVNESMTADIQLSQRVRKLVSEDGSGTSDNGVWTMFCKPAVAIRIGDRVSDGTLAFAVEAVGDWGSHVECVMSAVV